jgi:osmotically-inducible protein OsmY
MRDTLSESHPASRFWVAWAARDLFLIAAAGAFFVGGSYWRSQQTQSPPAAVPANAADATSPQSERMRAASDADRRLESRIRTAITRDQLLSLEDEDIQIVARDGSVTLTGIIHSHDEKSAISFTAAQIAGASNLRNQLTVKSQK